MARRELMALLLLRCVELMGLLVIALWELMGLLVITQRLTLTAITTNAA